MDECAGVVAGGGEGGGGAARGEVLLDPCGRVEWEFVKEEGGAGEVVEGVDFVAVGGARDEEDALRGGCGGATGGVGGR